MEKTKIEIRFDHRNLEDSKALVAYAHPKLIHACQHGRAIKVSLIFSIQNAQFHQVDAVVHLPKHHTIAIRESTRDMYQSVDLIVDKIEKVIRKNTELLSKFSHESPCRSKEFFGREQSG